MAAIHHYSVPHASCLKRLCHAVLLMPCSNTVQNNMAAAACILHVDSLMDSPSASPQLHHSFHPASYTLSLSLSIPISDPVTLTGRDRDLISVPFSRTVPPCLHPQPPRPNAHRPPHRAHLPTTLYCIHTVSTVPPRAHQSEPRVRPARPARPASRPSRIAAVAVVL